MTKRKGFLPGVCFTILVLALGCTYVPEGGAPMAAPDAPDAAGPVVKPQPPISPPIAARGLPSLSSAVKNNLTSIVFVSAPNAGATSSGVIISADGYILTSNRVASIKSVPKLHVTLGDSRILEARYVGGDKKTDLALVKIESKVNLTPVRFGDSARVAMGDWLVVLAAPFGFQPADGSPSAAVGMVFSAPSDGAAAGPAAGSILFDAPAPPGGSGSAVFDRNGRLVGIWTFFVPAHKPSRPVMNPLSSAVPVNKVREFLKKLNAAKPKQTVGLVVPKVPKPAPARVAPALAAAIAKNRPSVVVVRAGDKKLPPVSGTVVSKDGLILTSYIVVSRSPKKVKVMTSDFKVHDAVLVGSDPLWDLALIKIKPKGKTKVNLKPVVFGSSSKAAVGDWVVVLGNTFGFAGAGGRATATSGMLSAKHRAPVRFGPRNRILRYADAMQFDAATTPGSVGAPLLNRRGETIGICVRVSQNPRQEAGLWGLGYGLSFALPIDQVRSELPALKKGKTLHHGLLGVQMRSTTQKEAEEIGQPGAVVTMVVAKSAAAEAGIKKDDILLTAQGIRLTSQATAQNVIGSRLADETITVRVYRKGKILTFKPKLKPRP